MENSRRDKSGDRSRALKSKKSREREAAPQKREMAVLTSGDDMISFDTTDWRWVPQRFLLELATDGNETDVVTAKPVTTAWSNPDLANQEGNETIKIYVQPSGWWGERDEVDENQYITSLYTILPALVLFSLAVFQVAACMKRHRRLQDAERRRRVHDGVVGGAAPREEEAEPQGLDSVKLEMVHQYSFRRVGSKAKKDDKYHTIECSICMEKFLEGDQIRELPGCGHIFHAECVAEWLKLQTSCPVCRRNIAETLDDQEKRQGTPEGDGAAVTIASVSVRGAGVEMDEVQDIEAGDGTGGEASEADTSGEETTGGSRSRMQSFMSCFFASPSGRESVWDWARASTLPHIQERRRRRARAAAAEASIRNDQVIDVVESTV